MGPLSDPGGKGLEGVIKATFVFLKAASAIFRDENRILFKKGGKSQCYARHQMSRAHNLG